MKAIKKIGKHLSKNLLWYNILFILVYIVLFFTPLLTFGNKRTFLIYECLKVNFVGSNITNSYIIMASIISSIILLIIDSIKVIKKKHIIITPILLLINIVSYAIFPMVYDNGCYYPLIYVAWLLISIQIIMFALYLIYEFDIKLPKLPKTKTQKLQDELTLLKLRMSEKEDMLKEREQLVNSINSETDPEQKKKLQSALDYLEIKIEEVNVKEVV